ncbi:MAG TPA: UvrD-helicase domain-containing protein [Burkholderiaceae bacterium]|nr:UvrD-helicase domain-containing protein [Burkholderiaceae bacterium]
MLWEPSLAGRLFTWAKNWSIQLENDCVRFDTGQGSKHDFAKGQFPLRKVSPGLFWATVHVAQPNGNVAKLKGLPNKAARQLSSTIALSRADHFLKVIDEWCGYIRDESKKELKRRGWLSFEFKQRLTATKPAIPSWSFDEPLISKHIQKQSPELKQGVAFWKADLAERLDAWNEKFSAERIISDKEFFDTIEKSPLTEEQAKAVLCFNNRVLLVASAGSGKTSTMVAKAAYAIKNRYFLAENILLLAFNRDAATELQTRLKKRLSAADIPHARMTTKTFHALGLEIIGAATGKKPSLASWIENDIAAMQDMVDDLRDQDADFRTGWDIFRLVLAQDLPKFGHEHEDGESWDRTNNRNGFWTLNNEIVKSRGEQLIANWLFYNGVRYQYERPYPQSTADATHSQYHPDFYFPDVDAYLEHWAVDENGNPPEEFEGYREGMAWKRALHQQHQTKLLETTMADLWSGRAFRTLAKDLTALGIELDPNPDREVPGRKPIEYRRLLSTFRSFLTHVKSNRLSIEELRNRLATGMAGHFRYRHELFLRLFEAIWDAWETKLKADDCIDFEDMLGIAADCVEQGRWKSPYALVMVDEFQDTSRARERLVRALLAEPDRCLFAVGDDWQSINRFAGSDLEVMTDFDKAFPGAVTLHLERTFRCPQSLCDISSQFVQKNPKQLRKVVRSTRPDVLNPVTIQRVSRKEDIGAAVEARIQELASQRPSDSKKMSIYVLGRYNMDEEYMPKKLDLPGVEVKFASVHRSKGLEADHIIVPRMTAETLGFPSQVEDDPVLQLAMPNSEDFEHAEERRLFYVALTRTQSSVTLITVACKESPFVLELMREHNLQATSHEGEDGQLCEVCGDGFLVPRNSKHGKFLGCTNYPRCTNRQRMQ